MRHSKMPKAQWDVSKNIALQVIVPATTADANSEDESPQRISQLQLPLFSSQMLFQRYYDHDKCHSQERISRWIYNGCQHAGLEFSSRRAIFGQLNVGLTCDYLIRNFANVITTMIIMLDGISATASRGDTIEGYAVKASELRKKVVNGG